MRLAINVTQSHIDQGCQVSSQRCALALAISSRFGGKASMGTRNGYFYDETGEITRCNLTDGRINFNMPLETRFFVMNFDSFKPVKPSIYYIDIHREQATEDLSSV